MSVSAESAGGASRGEKQERLRRALLERSGRTRTSPASFAQERLWLLDRIQPAGAAYNLPAALRLRGAVDAAALERALGEIVRRHEVLRTVFADAEGAPVQVIAPAADFHLPIDDLSGADPAEREAEAMRRALAEARRPFDLAAGPLFRTRLLRMAPDDHLLVICMHHVAGDGWSLGVLYRELSALYGAFRRGEGSPLPPPVLQYADHALREQREPGAGALERQVAWWRERLAGAPALLELPADHPRPAAPSFRGAQERLELDADLSARLRALAREEGATLHAVFLAAFQLLLARYAGTDDVVVGTPVSGRTRADVEGLIGFFVNTVVLRADTGGDPSFRELLRRARAATLEAVAHQDVPFERLVAELSPARTLSHAPLFQVMFSVDEGAGAPALDGVAAEAVELATDAAKFDLALVVAPRGEEVYATLAYATDLFEPATVRRMLGHLARVLEQVADDPDRPLSALEPMDAEERATVVHGWNQTDAPFPADRCIHELFQAQAARTPDATAAVHRHESLTYAALNARANRIAHHLRALGVGPEVRVGVCLERGVELLAALLGVLKAGGAYVPLDPAYPAERLSLTLADADAPVVLTQRALADGIPAAPGVRIVVIDEEEEARAIAARPGDDLPPAAAPRNLAYLIYTSGSTGRPKGVAIEHRSAAALLAWAWDTFSADELGGMLASTSVCFDMSVFELFAPLGRGGRVIVVENALALPAAPAAGEVRVLDTVPSAAAALVATGGIPAGVRTVVLGGEPLSAELVDALYALGVERVFDGYGPSEDTTFSTFAARRPGGPVTIGRVLSNSRAYVLDGAMRPVPIGVAGELYLGGAGVTRGYLGGPGLTAERYLPDPFSAEPGARLYRTGDRVRWRADGTLAYGGRLDTQVKVRGYRVEPGEVEAALRRAGAGECAVAVRADERGDPRLVAYVVGGEVDGLRAALRAALPDYMVPAAFVVLDALPRTPNGKLDRRALPAPDFRGAGDGYAAPRTPVEEVLAGVWARVLGRERVGTADGFFDLGGHSLLAARVVAAVREAFGVDLSLRALFEAPTVAELAARVDAARRAEVPAAPPIITVERDGPLALSFAQERLWFLGRMQPGSPLYNLPAALRLRGPLDAAALEAALGGVVARHEALRTVFLEVDGGPVQLPVPFAGFALPLDDLRDEDDPAAEARRHAADEALRPFDLSAGPPFRARLLRTADDDHLLVLCLHHAAGDGASVQLLVRELAARYAAAREGAEPALPPPAVQYADFAAWQRERLRGEALERPLAYWRARLGDAPALLELPADHPRPALRGHAGGRVPVELPAELGALLRALARAEGATLYMVVLAAFQALLAKYAGVDDVVVGSPAAGREREEVRGIVGLFAHTLALRTELSGDPTFHEVVRRVRAATLGAWEHQELPFERLVAELRPERSLSHAPLFQVAFALEEGDGAPLPFAGLVAEAVEVELPVAKFDLTLALRAEGDAVRGALVFAADLLEPETAERMAAHLRVLLERAAADPSTPLSRLELLAGDERRRVLEEWSGADLPYHPRPVHLEIAERAARAPDAEALVFGGRTVTYGALEADAARLARHLAARGAGPETVVAILAERGPATVTAMLAVLKAGAAFLPLDPAYPPDRLRHMLADSGARLLVVQGSLPEGLDAEGLPRVVDLRAEAEAIAARPAQAPEVEVDADHLAYVIYTSGSTGRPKGVMVTHRGIPALAGWVRGRLGQRADDRVLQFASFSFDAAVHEVLPALAAGATLVLAERPALAPGDALRETLRRGRVTFATLPPSVLAVMDPAELPGLRVVVSAGEALSPAVAARWAGAVELHNGYGPTETTVAAASARVAADGRPPAIGTPVQHARAYVLDPAGLPVPPGVPGELWVGGAGVARGYLGRPGLTAERFVPDPFSTVAGARAYRTGDRVRWRGDGALEYLGRLDAQVKVRGFRIEPGEIEAALRAFPGVDDCAAVAREDVPGEPRLAAYVVGEADPDALRAYLRGTLPDYLVPSAIVPLDALPLTPNGKLDRRALPAPAVRGGGARLRPETGLEARLAAIWRELLGVDEVGAEDSFFDLGGHSLLLVRLQSRLAAELGHEVPVVDLFQHPTVRALAARLRGAEGHAVREGAEARAAAPRTGREIAVVGMAVRVPGADGVEAFWRNLRGGVESISRFTRQELVEAGTDPALLDDPDFVPARGELVGADELDAALFHLTPRDAEILDPQHRVLLECAWSALEHAGYDPARLDRPVGVFAGSGANAYGAGVEAAAGLVRAVGPMRVALANDKDHLSAGISYRLNLRGPSLAVQTACSTSLVAVHLACQSLLTGECHAALAGGVSIRVPLRRGYRYTPDGILSPDGRCRPFDAASQGTVGGNGAGMVLLKRLDDALADGDTVHAVIRATAINNDGAQKVGYTAPGVEGQARVLADALVAAGVDPATVQYVETHGTGTPLGDAIELRAMARALGSARGAPAWIGSVKANVGHLDAAAGVAGLVKTVLALEHGEIPPSLHCAAPHPEIAASGGRVAVNTALRTWERAGGAPRRAGVSSFGIGGTNAHAVLEEAPPASPSGPSRALQLLVVSARTARALAASAGRLAAHLEGEAPPLADAAYTLQRGRRELEHRLAVVCASGDEGAAALRAAAARESAPVARADRPVAFLFPGMGTHYAEMGRGLYEAEPAYRQAVDECCALLRPLLGTDLREALFPASSVHSGAADGGWDLRRMLGRGADAAPSALDDTRLGQPALFVTEYALARLWMSWGVAPRALVGHSLGEYVAACVAGVMGVEDALRLVALRARLIAGLPAGALLAVPLAEAALRAILPPALDVAAVNTPESCVVAGPADAVAAFEAALAARGTVSRRLATRHAFHSRAMRPVAAELERLLDGVALSAPRIPFVSNVTGTWIGDDEARSPAYWARHLCGTVRFADGVATLREEPGWVLVEMGPGQTLGAWAMQHPAGGAGGHTVLSALRHRDNRVNDLRFLLEALGSAWCAGVQVDWQAFSAGERRHRVPLPGYPFERRRFWVDPPAPAAAARAEDAKASAEVAGPTSEIDQRGRDAMDEPLAVPAASSPRQRAVLDRLRELAAELTGIDRDRVATDASFFQAGFDSLLLLQAVQALETRFGARVSLVQLLEEIVTLDALAAHLDRVLAPDVLQPAPQPPAAEPAAGPASSPAAFVPSPRVVPAPPAFYPPAAPLVPHLPDAAGGGESAMERLMAQQLQLMAQQSAMQFQLMAQQIAALGGAPAASFLPTEPVFASASAPSGSTGSAESTASAASSPSTGPAVSAVSSPSTVSSAGSESPVSIDTTATAAAPALAETADLDAQAGTANGNGRGTGDGARAVPQSPRARIQPETFVAYQPLNTEGAGGMTAKQRAYLDGFVARYVERTRASRAHQERYHLPLADSRVTARFRRAWKGILYPIVSTRALGSRVWDLDGNEYVDTGMAFGCNLFGHAPDFVSAAIRDQVERGYGVGPQSPDAGRAAELVCRVGGNERAVFCNSGTEAVMGAIRAARTFTGRTKVAYFTGSYHGWSDIVQGRPFTAGGRSEVRPTAPGISQLPLQDVLMLDYDQPESLELLARHLHELAVVMVEPVQSRRLDIQPRAFLHELRRMTRESGTVLLFDELITGFRIGPGGAQQFFGIDADLVTYGKIVAGGLPMGVVAGKREVMSVFDGGPWRYDDDSYPTAQRTLFAGAFFKHPLSMAVACAILGEVERRGAPMYEALNARSAALVARLNAFFEAERFPVTTVHFGSCFRFFFGPEVAYPDLFSHHLIHEGVHVIPETGTHFLSDAHTDEDLDFVFHAVCRAVRAMREGGFIPRPSGAPAAPSADREGGLLAVASSAAESTVSNGADRDAVDADGARVLPLTEGQRQLWVESQMGDEAGLAYIESTSIRLRGALDAEALRAALRAVVARHDTLRMTFGEDGEGQRIHPSMPVEVPLADLRGADVDAWLRRTVRRPFDLVRGPLFRFDLAAVADDEHLLVVSVHHAALDGWSFGVVLGELDTLCRAAKAGVEAELPPRPDHGALVRAQVRTVRDDAAAEAWWRQRFADGVPVLELPTDRPRPPVRSYRGDRVLRVLGDGVLRRLAEAGRPHGLTVFHTVFAAFYAWLGRLSGQDDLVAGTPAAGQAAAPGAAALVGYAINVLPVRVTLDPAAPFVEHARGVRRALMHAVEHQNVSLPKLVEALVRPRDPARPPLFAVMLDLDRATTDASIGDLRATFESNFGGGSKLDLNLELTETADTLRVACDYSTDLFDRETVDAWLDGFARLLEQVAQAPGTPLARLSLAGPVERARVVEEWNRTELPVEGGACVHALFAARAAAHPDAPALEWGGARWTYGELDAAANRLARVLRRHGVGVEDRVGVLLERGAEAVAATLAVLKAGGCCVPVDTSYPTERMALMLEDAGARLLLTRGALAEGFAGAGVQVVRLEEVEAQVAAEPADALDDGAPAESLAYVFYTSGSTGRPKGVMMGHREVARFALALPACMPLAPGHRVAQASNVSFDAAVFEVWGALVHGATLVGLDRDVLLSAPALAGALRELRITHLYQTAALFSQHVREQVDVYATLEQLVFGAEAVGTESARRMLAGGRPARVLHEYGPTEATVWCTLHPVEEIAPGAAALSIGRPVPNARIYVLDGEMQPVPPAVPGELYAGGAGVVRGYHGRPALTAERFVPDPFSAEPGARMYRTGDRARWRPEGRLEFMGRFDDQVKVRGFRIEPAEVEAALAAHPGVRQARVAVREDAPGDKRLVAYVAGDADGDALRAHLRGRLPEYMVPHAFVVMERLPLTPNGKLDRRALPAPTDAAGAGEEYVAPRTPVEAALAEVWAGVLRLERVGVHDGFFERGGDSILAIQVVSRARRAGVQITPRQLFENPTVAALAAVAAATAPEGEAEPVEDGAARRYAPADFPLAGLSPTELDALLAGHEGVEDLYPLSPLQEGLLFHALAGADTQPYQVQIVQRLEGPLDAGLFRRAWDDAVRRHPALRTAFHAEGARPLQRVQAAVQVPWTEEDWSALAPVEQNAALERFLAEDRARGFDLARAPLMRFALFRLASDAHIFAWSEHHLLLDGWACARVLAEVLHACRTARGPDPAQIPAPRPYRDFVAWLAERDAEAAERHWRQTLAGFSAPTPLPADRPAAPGAAHRHAAAHGRLSAGATRRVEEAARRAGVTLNTVLAGAWALLLARCAGEEDVVFGTTVSGRPPELEGVEEMVGLFINTLPVRVPVPGGARVAAWLRGVQRDQAAAREFEYASLTQVQEWSEVPRGTPLFESHFLFENLHVDRAAFAGAGDGLRVANMRTLEWNSYPLSLRVDASAELRVALGYDAGRFDAATAGRLLRMYTGLVEQMAADVEASLASLSLADADERRRVVEEWNRTAADYAAESCIHQLFEAQARRTPDAAALVFGGETLAYAEVDARANQLAHHLVRLGVGREVRVGVCMERAPELIVSLVAVMKAGGAWVPADPGHPAERIAYVMRDGGVRVLLTQARLVDRVPVDEGTAAVCVDEAWETIAAESAEPIESRVTAENLAYVIYTSGSTGRPKGVAMHHRGVVNYIEWGIRHYGADRGNGSPVFSSLAVDLTITNLLPLFAGRPVHLLPEQNAVEALAEALRGNPGFGPIKITPVHLSLLTPLLTEDEARSAAHTLVVGADFLAAETTLFWQDHAPGVRLMNEYGPTETVVGCSAHTLVPGVHREGPVPVGGPIQNLSFHVLDGHGQPLPPGVTGELHIGGAGVARGYLGRPALTAEKFVPDPFAGGGARMYRTGDRARWTEDGGLVVLGRTDAQVKIRGYRVEPGEVEAALRRHPDVGGALVVPRDDGGGRRLVAYVAGTADAATLRAHLRASLPEHMVPAAFVTMDTLPTTATGKVDPRMLPAPDAPAGDEAYVPPRTPVEEALAEIWAQVLGVEAIGAHADFFALGGHSLRAMRLIAAVRAAFGLNLSVGAVFAAPTLAGMAAEVERLAYAAVEAMPEARAEELAALAPAGG